MQKNDQTDRDLNVFDLDERQKHSSQILLFEGQNNVSKRSERITQIQEENEFNVKSNIQGNQNNQKQQNSQQDFLSQVLDKNQSLLKEIMPIYVGNIVESLSLEMEEKYNEIYLKKVVDEKRDQELLKLKDKEIERLNKNLVKQNDEFMRMAKEKEIEFEQILQSYKKREESIQEQCQKKLQYYREEFNEQVIIFLELKNYILNLVQHKYLNRILLEQDLEQFNNLFQIQVLKKKSIYQERQVIWDLFHELKEKLAGKDTELVGVSEDLRILKQEYEILEKEMKSCRVQLNKANVNLQDYQAEKILLMEELRNIHILYEKEMVFKSTRFNEMVQKKDDSIDELTDKYLKQIMEMERERNKAIKEKTTLEIQAEEILRKKQSLENRIIEMQDEINLVNKRNQKLIQERDNQQQKHIQRIQALENSHEQKLFNQRENSENAIQTLKNEAEAVVGRWRKMYSKLMERLNFLDEEKNYDEIVNEQTQTLMREIEYLDQKINILEKQKQKLENILDQKEQLLIKKEDIIQNQKLEIDKLKVQLEKVKESDNDTQYKAQQIAQQFEKEKKMNQSNLKEIDKLRELLRIKEKELIKQRQYYEGNIADINSQQRGNIKSLQRDLEQKMSREIDEKTWMIQNKNQDLQNMILKLQNELEEVKKNGFRHYQINLKNLENNYKKIIEEIQQENEIKLQNFSNNSIQTNENYMHIQEKIKNIQNQNNNEDEIQKIFQENRGENKVIMTRLGELASIQQKKLVQIEILYLIVQSKNQSIEKQLEDLQQQLHQNNLQQIENKMRLAIQLIDKDEQIDDLEYKLSQSICLEQDIIKKARKYKDEISKTEEKLKEQVKELERQMKFQIAEKEKQIQEKFEKRLEEEYIKNEVFTKELRDEFIQANSYLQRMLNFQRAQYQELLEVQQNKIPKIKNLNILFEKESEIKQLKLKIQKLEEQQQLNNQNSLKKLNKTNEIGNNFNQNDNSIDQMKNKENRTKSTSPWGMRIHSEQNQAEIKKNHKNPTFLSRGKIIKTEISDASIEFDQNQWNKLDSSLNLGQTQQISSLRKIRDYNLRPKSQSEKKSNYRFNKYNTNTSMNQSKHFNQSKTSHFLENSIPIERKTIKLSYLSQIQN